ncbi:MAG: hypothetical protein HY903_05345 [Deltaproteobacteria bacterium]|nr:hypothetical protein [Deltaproteobacteria bacterium]
MKGKGCELLAVLFATPLLVAAIAPYALVDGATRRVARTTWELSPFESRQIAALSVADLASDGQVKVVYLARGPMGSTSDVVVHDAASLTEVWRATGVDHGADFVVGNVDADPALEIVTAAGIVYDGATLQNEWQRGTPFGDTVTIGDVDGDSTAEVIGATEADGTIQGINVSTRSLVWSAAGLLYSGAMTAAELDADAGAELVVLRASSGRVDCYSFAPATPTATLALDWSVSGMGSGFLGSIQEIVVLQATGWPSPYLRIFDAALQPRAAPFLTDRTGVSVYIEPAGSGRRNVLVGVESLAGDVLMAVDPATGREIWRSPPLLGSVQPNSLSAADVNGDAQAELVFGTELAMYVTR